MIILFQLEVLINISEPQASIVKLVSIWALLRRTMICGAQPLYTHCTETSISKADPKNTWWASSVDGNESLRVTQEGCEHGHYALGKTPHKMRLTWKRTNGSCSLSIAQTLKPFFQLVHSLRGFVILFHKLYENIIASRKIKLGQK